MIVDSISKLSWLWKGSRTTIEDEVGFHGSGAGWRKRKAKLWGIDKREQWPSWEKVSSQYTKFWHRGSVLTQGYCVLAGEKKVFHCWEHISMTHSPQQIRLIAQCMRPQNRNMSTWNSINL